MYLKDCLKDIVNRYCYCYTSNKGNQDRAIYFLFLFSLNFMILGALSVTLLVKTTTLKNASYNTSKPKLKVMAGKTSPSTSNSVEDSLSYMNKSLDYTNANEKEDYSLYPSPYDGRDYEFTTLPNGLRVLVISNPLCFKSGASLTVSVGYFNDPIDYSELAHLCEHMIFRGGKKESFEPVEFSNFVTSHSGDYNALTKEEQTTFTFYIQPKFFKRALSLFAEMFLHPEFDPQCLQSEILTVDQEFQQNICDDDWSTWHLLKLVSNSKSSFHRFHNGDMKSLNKTGLLVELKRFYAKYYIANQVSAWW